MPLMGFTQPSGLMVFLLYNFNLLVLYLNVIILESVQNFWVHYKFILHGYYLQEILLFRVHTSELSANHIKEGIPILVLPTPLRTVWQSLSWLTCFPLGLTVASCARYWDSSVLQIHSTWTQLDSARAAADTSSHRDLLLITSCAC